MGNIAFCPERGNGGVAAGASFKDRAIWFLKNYEVVWTTWVPFEVAERVNKAVEDR